MSGLVIVGGCYAASHIAASARQSGYADPITLVSDEAMLPYQRPPLSKGFLAGTTAETALPLRSEKFYVDNCVELLLDTRTERIDRAAKIVETKGGRKIPYEQLALAVGARARMIPVLGADLDGVLALRTVADARSLKQRIAMATTVAIIGGGFIGLEVAAVCATLGKQVTVIEALDRLLVRAMPARLAAYIADVHRSHGVKLMFGAAVREIRGEGGRARAVACGDGTEVAADLVVVSIGVVPNIELARDCGLRCENGIVVDRHARTEDPAIVAAGDCTSHPSRYAGGNIRLESVQNASDQAKAAGATIAGVECAYDALPWFWSDQYDMKLQMAGLSQGHDTDVLRGSIEEGKFSVFYLREGRLIAADTVSKPAEHMVSRRLIAAKANVTPEQVADTALDLKTLLKS
jgi:3-phenylpropionate/trans-cinnamate dioxygenase ferredoxin reductase subunit